MASSSSPVYLNEVDLELDRQCPICLEPFHPPVYQCNKGHVVCRKCVHQCKQCSICREPMPWQRVRNLQFEKVLAGITKAKANIPCPRRGDGCTAIATKKCMEKHLQDECAFVPRRLCLRLGIPGVCFEEYCAVETNQLIQHLVSKHKLNGLTNDLDGQSNSATLELVGTIGTFGVQPEFLLPHFIRFDGNMFFIKKYCNVPEGLMAIVVFMNGVSATARKYSALVQLIPLGEAVLTSSVLEFKQNEILLLTKKDEALLVNPYNKFEYHHVVVCKVPLSIFKHYDSTSNNGKGLEYKARVTISKPSSTVPKTAPCTQTHCLFL